VEDHFPLHEKFRHEIFESWQKHKVKLFFGMLTGNYKEHMQPLNFIASYYGEKTAFYFAFMTFFTGWLLIPALPGLALFIYQMILLKYQSDNDLPMTIDTPWACLYCLVMALWSAALMEAWKRRQNEFAHIWEMSTTERDESIRPEFKADYVISSRTKAVSMINTAKTRTRRFFSEIPITLLSVGAVIGCFIGNVIFQRDNTSTNDSIASSIISAVIIIVLGEIYEYVAVLMANWENHKYEDEYQDSLISKFFVFQFVNSNIALFFIAFYQ